jgi:putative salt-induced outer membrane protein
MRNPSTKLELLIPYLAMIAAPLVAQEPCPCKETPPPSPPPFSGKLDLAYAATSGNTSTSSLGLGVDLVYRTAPWTFEGTFGYLHAESEHVTTAETLSGTLKGSRDLTPAFDVFVGAGYYRNTFSGIDHRVGGEGGAGYKILNQPDHLLLRTEAGIGYASEARTDADTLNYATARLGLKFVWKFSKSADFTEEAAWTEDFSDTEHWVFRNKAAVSASLTKLLSLKLSWSLVYNNQPPPGFGKTDTVTAAAVVATF